MQRRVADDRIGLEICKMSFREDNEAFDEWLADQCDVLQQGAAGRFRKESTRCSTEVKGAFTEISRSVPAHGVVTVTMTHDGQLAQLVPAEVVGISGTVANSEPDALS